MKPIQTLALLLLVFSACSTESYFAPVADRKVEFIDQTGVDKITAYRRALAHLSKTMADSNKSLKVHDETSGQIVAQGNVDCNSLRSPVMFATTMNAKFVIDFQAKDQRSRLVFEDVQMAMPDGSFTWSGQIGSKEDMEKVRLECLEPIHAELINSIHDSKKDNW